MPTDFDESCLNDIQSWSQCKQNILNSYTTSEKLSFQSCKYKHYLLIIHLILKHAIGFFLFIVSKSMQSATIRSRLEELEEFDDQLEYSEKELYDLTQQEFVTHMDNLGKEMIEAWNNEQRVKSLKIIIQVLFD